MTPNDQRKWLIIRYSNNPSFKSKVEKMSDKQVFAFYQRVVKSEGDSK